MVLLANFSLEGELDIVELLGKTFGAGLLFCRLAHSRGLHLLDDSFVCAAGLDGDLARQQEIAAISFGDLHDVAAMAKLFYIFFQNDFHEILSSCWLLASGYWPKLPRT